MERKFWYNPSKELNKEEAESMLLFFAIGSSIVAIVLWVLYFANRI